MAKVIHYANIIKDVLGRFKELCDRQPTAGVDSMLICDDQNFAYLFLVTGWTKHERVRGATLFLRVKNDKIWVEEDWTDYEIVDKLLKAGVPKSDIVLAFHSPEKRPYTEFAVA